MANAGNWMFKPRENPRNLFIRPEPTAPSPVASLVAMSPARGMHSNEGSGPDANVHGNRGGGDRGKQVMGGKHSGGTPERRHVHFEVGFGYTVQLVTAVMVHVTNPTHPGVDNPAV
jgi:hypothetical protein